MACPMYRGVLTSFATEPTVRTPYEIMECRCVLARCSEKVVIGAFAGFGVGK